MKKFILIIFIVLFESITVFAEEDTVDMFEVYDISRESFAKFIENPARESVERENGYTIFCKYKKSDKAGYIKREVVNLQTNSVFNQEAKSGVFRMGDETYPAYTETLECFGTNESVALFLKKFGMECEVNDYFFIWVWDPIPMSVWCETDKGIYFITIVFNLDSREYDYYLYSADEYYEKYRTRSGKLLVNGVDVTEDNYVRFEGSVFFAPFRTIMERLGYDVIWDEEYGVALFYVNNNQYALNPLKFSGILPSYAIRGEHTGFIPDYGFVKDGRIILCSYGSFGKLMKLLNVDYNVDYDKAEIRIVSQ